LRDQGAKGSRVEEKGAERVQGSKGSRVEEKGSRDQFAFVEPSADRGIEGPRVTGEKKRSLNSIFDILLTSASFGPYPVDEATRGFYPGLLKAVNVKLRHSGKS